MVALKFEWINSNDDGQHFDEDKRRAIRVQAMKAAAAARRKTGTWGKQNMRQTETVRQYSNIDGTALEGNNGRLRMTSMRARDAWKTKDHVIPIIQYLKGDSNPAALQLGTSAIPQFEQWNARPGRPMPLPPFERLAADVGVNILDLDELTSVATGQVAGTMLAKNRASLNKLLVRRRHSYLFQIPARYGQSTCLDDALHCVASKAKTLLVPGCAASAEDLYGYGKALRSLQAAVNDPDAWSDPNILGAIEILSICEVLDAPARSSAWENHIAGASRLIRARGPSRFTTDYEKALLTSMLSPLMCEAFRLREPCFLDEEPWQDVLRSLAIPNAPYFSPRGLGYVHLWLPSVTVPRLLVDVRKAVSDPSALTPKQIDNLEKRCRALKNRLLAWQEEFKEHQTDKLSDKMTLGEADLSLELDGSAMAIMAIISRLLSAVSPADRITEEQAAIKYSQLMRRVLEESMEKNKYASFYLEQKIVVADSILSTTHIWLRGLENERQPRNRLIEIWKFQAWVDGIPDDYDSQYDSRLGYGVASPIWNELSQLSITAQ